MNGVSSEAAQGSLNIQAIARAALEALRLKSKLIK